VAATTETAALPSYLVPVMHAGEKPAFVLMMEPHIFSKAANGERPPFTADDLRQMLRDRSIDQWFVLEDEVQRFLKEQLNDFSVSVGYRIAEARDCEIRVQIAADRLSASVSTVLAHGGKPVSADGIFQSLAQAGVTFGILESKIRELSFEAPCEEVLIAEGIPAKPGDDARFEKLFEESSTKGSPQERKDGKVDYHELGTYASVEPGTPLLQKIPVTAGVPGTGVDGLPIAPKPGKDAELVPGAGTEISADDPNLLLATIGGQPVYLRDTVKVVDKLEVPRVDFKTGNIDFDGSVLVRGPIMQGFKVKAGGDLVVFDEVEALELTAGGSVVIKGGIFGKHQCQITAHGDVKAKFLNDCVVHCGGDLMVEDLLAGCTVICEGTLKAGQAGGKGQVYGGHILATKGVRAKILGCATEVGTTIEVSTSPKLRSRHKELQKEIKLGETKLDELKKNAEYLKRQPSRRQDPRLDQITEAIFLMSDQIEELRAEAAQLAERIDTGALGGIVANEAHGGVTLQIRHQTRKMTSLVKSIRFEDASEEKAVESPKN
jgi:uncharacterized protein